jgi:hypothetical protein
VGVILACDIKFSTDFSYTVFLLTRHEADRLNIQQKILFIVKCIFFSVHECKSPIVKFGGFGSTRSARIAVAEVGCIRPSHTGAVRLIQTVVLAVGVTQQAEELLLNTGGQANHCGGRRWVHMRRPRLCSNRRRRRHFMHMRRPRRCRDRRWRHSMQMGRPLRCSDRRRWQHRRRFCHYHGGRGRNRGGRRRCYGRRRRWGTSRRFGTRT